jgi:exopolysaccharide production protein ExoQ
MPPSIAVLVFALGILGLFVLDRDPRCRTSKALWIPVLWVSIAGSRMVSQWLDLNAASSADVYLEGSPLDRPILMGLLAIGVMVLFSRRRRVGTVLRANIPILVFFFYCAASILWSDYPDVAFKRWTKAVGDFAMVLIILTDRDRLSAIKRFLTRIGFVLLPLSILFIKYYPELGRGYSPWEGKVSYNGVATDKNMLGMLCLVMGLGLLWRCLEILRDGKRTRKSKPLIAMGSILATTVWLLWIADSATSSSCFLLGGGLMVLMNVPAIARRRLNVHLLVAAVVFVSFSAVFLNFGLVGAVARDTTLSGRTGIWASALSLVSNPLIGTGFESFWLGSRLERMWRIYWFHPIEAHNGYLEIYLNLGWAGVVLLGVLIVAGYRGILTALRRDFDPAGSLRLAYFAVALTYNFTEAAFKTMNLVWIAFLIAITVVPGLLSKSLQPASTNVSKRTCESIQAY